MRLYLDICALKRPFDDQTQERTATETRAVLSIVRRIESGDDRLVWSTALTLENDADPDVEARNEVTKFAEHAISLMRLTTIIEARIEVLVSFGIRPLDAAHIAFAEQAACDVLITCDDQLMRRAARTRCLIKIMNPLQYIREVSHDR